jgi:hypothetical protein
MLGWTSISLPGFPLSLQVLAAASGPTEPQLQRVNFQRQPPTNNGALEVNAWTGHYSNPTQSIVLLFIPISRLIVVHAQLNALGNPQRKTRTSFRDLGEALAAASG